MLSTFFCTLFQQSTTTIILSWTIRMYRSSDSLVSNTSCGNGCPWSAYILSILWHTVWPDWDTFFTWSMTVLNFSPDTVSTMSAVLCLSKSWLLVRCCLSFSMSDTAFSELLMNSSALWTWIDDKNKIHMFKIKIIKLNRNFAAEAQTWASEIRTIRLCIHCSWL